MPSADKLFTLDPVDTELAKTTTSVSVQGPVNRSAENALFTKGLQSFASSLGSLGEASKQKQIIEDTRLAENAAIRGETRPSGILDVASEKFDNIVDANFADKTLGEIKAFVDGTAGHDLINNTGELSAKLQTADGVFDGFAATGLNGIRNNTTRQLFAAKAREKRDEVKRAIRDVDDDHNKSEVIHRIKNLLENSITTSKAVNEPLSSAITIELLNGLSDQALELKMGLGDKESKLLLIQLASQNPDVIADPRLMNSLFNEKFNKGVTYMDLYVKGLQVGNKDQDAASAVSIIDRYNKASQQHFLALERQDKKDGERAASEAEDAVLTAIVEGKSNGEVYGIAGQHNFSTSKVNKLIKAEESKQSNLQEAKGGAVGQSIIKQILASGGKLEDHQIRLALGRGNIRSEDHQFFMDLNKGEQEEFKSSHAAFNASIKQLKDKLPSLIRPSLGDSSVPMYIDGVYNEAYGQNFNKSKTANPADVANSLVKLQRLLEDTASKAASGALEATKTNDFDPKVIDTFAAEFNRNVLDFIDDLEKGIITKAQEKKANDEAKEARRADKEKKDKEATAAKTTTKEDKPPAPLPIKEIPEIEKQTSILEDPAEYVRLETEAVTQFLKQFQSEATPSKNTLTERPRSSSEQKYLKSIQADIAEKEKRDSKSIEPKSRTGLGSTADTVDANFDALPEIIGDMQRERFLQKSFQSLFDAAASDFKEAFPTRDRAFEESAAENLGFGEETPTDAAEVPAGGGSEEQLVLGKATGEVTSEGRKLYFNNFGGKSSEYTIGVKNSKINNGELTHIPSIFNGKIVSQKEASQIIIDNKGKDPETGRFITPGGDPEARSKSISIGSPVGKGSFDGRIQTPQELADQPFATLNLSKGPPPEVNGPIAAGSKSKKNDGGMAGRVSLPDFSAKDLPKTILKAKSRKEINEPDRVALVNIYKSLADKVWPGNPLMAKIAIAQAILESDWHVSDLARKHNNLFGIKEGRSVPGSVGSVSLPTDEQSTGGTVSTIVAKFSSNSSFLESFKQHRTLLETHYSEALSKGTFLEVAKALKAGGYATDINYAKKLNSIAITKRLKNKGN